MLNRQILIMKPETIGPIFRSVYDEARAVVIAGRPVELHLSEAAGRPSSKARRFYFGNVLAQIAEQAVDRQGAGATVEQWHEFFKEKLLPPRLFFAKDGGEILLPGTTKGLNAVAFDAYVKRVQAYSAQAFGVVFEDRFI